MRSGDQIEPPNCEDIQEIDGDQFANGTGNKRGVSQRGKAFLPPEDRVIVFGWLNISTDAATGIIWNTLLLTSSLWFDNYLIVAFSLQVHLRRAMPSMQGCIVISFKIVRRVAVEPNCLFSTDGQLYERKSANSKLSTRLLLEGMKVARTTMIRYVPITICCMFLNSIYLFMNNLFLFWVQIKDAIKVYEQKKPWHFAHCWEILRDEPKWNDYMLQCSKSKQTEKDNQATQPLDTPPAPIPTAGAPIERPEGRDSVKKRRTSVEESSSSVAVEMLEKIHVRGQQMDELEAKQKEELIDIERAKFDLQQKALFAKIEQGNKKLELQREISRDKKEISQEQIKLQRDIMETTRFQTEAQIMFTDLNSWHPAVRFWITKKQRDILIKEGINPDEVESASGASTQHQQPSGDN